MANIAVRYLANRFINDMDFFDTGFAILVAVVQFDAAQNY